jgi:DNA-binding NtrC family response regulator
LTPESGTPRPSPNTGYESRDRQALKRKSLQGHDAHPIPLGTLTWVSRLDQLKDEVHHLPVGLPQLRILVVDDDVPLRKTCCEVISSMGFISLAAGSVSEAASVLNEHQPVEMLLLDLKLPGGGGMKVLEEVKAHYPNIGVVIMTAFATVPSVVRAMRIGAFDYVAKPFALEELMAVLRRSALRLQLDLEGRRLREQWRTKRGMGDLIGTSPKMEQLYGILSRVAISSQPVLIIGEAGAGKELVASSIHHLGPNASKPFIRLDCGLLDPMLIERELFGQMKGVFTSAYIPEEGQLAAVGGGTIFLDEIDKLPPNLQAKLVRALQNKEVLPIGATHGVAISARVLAATCGRLDAMVEQGLFRKDLYYRLNVVNLQIPPLRERREDIAILAEYFLERLQGESNKSLRFSEEALNLLTEYDWSGNVRELQNVVERGRAKSVGPVLHKADLPTQLHDFAELRASDPLSMIASSDGSENGPSVSGGTILPIAHIEKVAILETIQRLNGDKLAAARLLGIGKTTLYRKLKEYGAH